MKDEEEIKAIKQFFSDIGMITIEGDIIKNVPSQWSDQIDILALDIENNILFAGECLGKDSSKKPQDDIYSLRELELDVERILGEVTKILSKKVKRGIINKIKNMKSSLKVVKIIFSSNKTSFESEKLLKYARKWKVVLINYPYYSYLIHMAKTIGPWFKVEFIRFLERELNKKLLRDSTERYSLEIKGVYRETDFGYVIQTYILAKDLIGAVSIKRISDIYYYASKSTGFQRLLIKGKLQNMREYLTKLSKKERILPYPTEVLLITSQKIIKSYNLDPKQVIRFNGENGICTLNLPTDIPIFTVVDGQHRIFSFSQDFYYNLKQDKGYKKGDKIIKEIRNNAYIPVIILFIRDLDLKIANANEKMNKMCAKVFLDINTKQKRLDLDDKLDLCQYLYPYDPFSLTNKLIKSLNNTKLYKQRISLLKQAENEKKVPRSSIVKYSGIHNIFVLDTSNQLPELLKELYEEIKRTGIKNKGGLYDKYYYWIELITRTFIDTLYSKLNRKKSVDKLFESKEHYLGWGVFLGGLLKFLYFYIFEKEKNRILECIRTYEKGGSKSRLAIPKLAKIFEQYAESISALTFTFEDIKRFKVNKITGNSWDEVEKLLRKKMENDA